MSPVLCTDARTYVAHELGVRQARQRADRLLADHGWVEDARADAVLVVAELAANALCHAPGTDFRVTLALHQDRVRVEVADGNARDRPRPRRASDEACDGRGLLLVESLSVEWGRVVDGSGSGKTVWALVRRGPG
ncbi:ATP-binding protein [Streptomyces zingiberis]|uniref:ATP-binding protein n=1 Tax=Streptomyces zingiberis TaxID=2053010 RepID=A0ABX1C2Y0_9ACTN|nr:ATP-binding protein [Streptomyces zingiberis]NJQ02272.1 ATP-binding protein [Streptomyces zingiberis]